jgi:RimJ/RimL family protein N-acetyltransferase
MGEWNGLELDDLVLTGARLTLRPWRAGDAPDVEAIMADAAMHEFLPLPDPYTRADADQFVTELGPAGRRGGTGIGSAVVQTATGRLVGAAELRLPGPRDTFGEIGYWVAVAAQGNGYAAEATRTLTTWAFDMACIESRSGALREMSRRRRQRSPPGSGSKACCGAANSPRMGRRTACCSAGWPAIPARRDAPVRTR